MLTLLIYSHVALTDDKVISPFELESAVHKEMLEIPETACNAHSICIKAACVITSFCQVVDLIGELLQFYHVQILLDHCRYLMASSQHNIKLFSSNQLQKFSECNTTLLLLRTLSSFFTWSNHSILRALVDQCSKAVNALERFGSRLDPLQLVAFYPILNFSADMLPNNNDTCTVLAVRFDKELYQCTLQHIYDVQSVMVEKCDITQHCLQLLAVRGDPTIFYWTLSKCVVNLITTNAPLQSDYLYSRGILEVLVYPDLLFATGDNVCYGSLAFECINTEMVCLLLFVLYLIFITEIST